MPRSSRQNELLRVDSQRRLLAAARSTFLRLGFDRATVRDIAQEAGVAQGLLYNYFRSKDDLLRAVFLEGTRDVAAALRAGATGATPEERLERLIHRSLVIVREQREFWQLSYMLRHLPRTAELLGNDVTAWTAAVRGELETLLAQVGHHDAAALARVLFGAIDGVAQHYVMDPDHYPLDATAECLARHFARPPGAERTLAAASSAPRATRTTRPRRATKEGA